MFHFNPLVIFFMINQTKYMQLFDPFFFFLGTATEGNYSRHKVDANRTTFHPAANEAVRHDRKGGVLL